MSDNDVEADSKMRPSNMTLDPVISDFHIDIDPEMSDMDRVVTFYKILKQKSTTLNSVLHFRKKLMWDLDKFDTNDVQDTSYIQLTKNLLTRLDVKQKEADKPILFDDNLIRAFSCFNIPIDQEMRHFDSTLNLCKAIYCKLSHSNTTTGPGMSAFYSTLALCEYMEWSFRDFNGVTDLKMRDFDSTLKPCESIRWSLRNENVPKELDDILQHDISEFDTFMSLIRDGDIDNVLSTFQTEYLSMTNGDGFTPLHLACENGHLELVIFFCSSNSIETCYNVHNYRPIHLACIHGHLEVVEYLYQLRCNKEALTDCGERPLHLACKHGHLEIVKLLCNQGCDKEALTDINRRPLHLACIHGHVPIVEYLCQQKCNIDALDTFGNKPIDVAFSYGHMNVVRYLCLQGCEIETYTEMDKSWPKHGLQKEHYEILQFLSGENLKRQLITKISNMKLECDDFCDHCFCLKSLNSRKSDTTAIIGRGSFGYVFKMEDPQLGYTFSVKSIYLDREASIQDTKHIEFNINNYVQILYHERIVQYFGAIDNGPDMYIFMEYVEGKSLDKYMNKKPLPHNKVIQYSKEILEGLKFLHQKKIIHRDIKPSNIMINTKDHVKLCDFGFSRYLESIGQRSQIHSADSSSKMSICGTANYMAPELVVGQKYSYSVDIWGLGASVVEMLTGVPPFHRIQHYAIIFQIGSIQKIEFVPSQPMSEGMSEYCAIIFHMDTKQNMEQKIEFVPAEPMSEDMKSLVGQMLCLCPSTRATADKLLEFIDELHVVTEPSPPKKIKLSHENS